MHHHLPEPVRGLLSVEDYASMPDDGLKADLVRGRLVREPFPGLEHGRIQIRLGEILARHIRERGLALACAGEFGVIIAEDPATVRGPDLAVLRKERLPDLHRSGFLRGAPELPIEIVSPSNSATAIHEKVLEYLAAGALVVWVIYPVTRTVVVHEGPRVTTLLRETDHISGGDLLPDLRIAVASLFDD